MACFADITSHGEGSERGAWALAVMAIHLKGVEETKDGRRD